MELQQLRKFVTVAEHGNISKAARALLISQPALSRSIHELEEEVGGKLMERGHAGVALTERGERLLVRARELLELEALMRRELQEEEAGTVRIVWRCGERFLVELLRQFRERNPEVRIEVLQNDDIALQNLQYDLIVAGALPDESGYRREPLLREPVLCAISAEHPLAGREKLTAEEFRSLPLIQFGGHRQVGGVIREQLLRSGLYHTPAILCDDVRTGCGMVAAGFGALLIPAYALDETMRRRIRLLPVEGLEGGREIYLYRRSDSYLTRGARSFAAFLLRYFAALEEADVAP